MNATVKTRKSSAERKAVFAKLFTGVVPAEVPTVSLTDQIREYRAEILAYHAKGFSWEQIRQAIKQPPLNIDASVATLVKSVGRTAKKKAEVLPLVTLPPRSTPLPMPPAAPKK